MRSMLRAVEGLVRSMWYGDGGDVVRSRLRLHADRAYVPEVRSDAVGCVAASVPPPAHVNGESYWRHYIMAWAGEEMRSMILSMERSNREVDYERYFKMVRASRHSRRDASGREMSARYSPEWAEPLD